jgi:signal transduction histidine kinase
VWTYYKNASIRIENFENDIIQRAGEQHLAAVQRNNYIYIVMLLLVLPTLFYTAFHSVKSYRYSEKHRLTAQSRNQLLTDQNELLEKRVSERTSVIREKNIALENAMQYIKEQHQMISDQNVRLGEEVERQTRKLQLANEELEDRIAKMEEYSFVISHKLRSPVANLMGLSELIELQQTEKNEKFIQYIGESARELDNILRDLNDFLLLEKAKLHFKTINLKSCIQHAKSQLRKEIEESQVEMSEELQVEYFQSQQSLLTKIIYNLLSNAIKFRYPGREHQVSIKSRKQEDRIIIEFRDNGLGINLKRYQKKLFQPYQRFHNHTQGKGVGLYLARLMAEKLGGSLGVESEVYEGSVFILKLPGQQS